MTLLYFTGFGSQSADEAWSSGGSISFVYNSNLQDYVLKVDATAAVAYLSFAKLTSAGRQTPSDVATAYASFRFFWDSTSGTSQVCYMRANGGLTTKCKLEISSTGYLTLTSQGGSTDTSASPLSINTVYRIEIMCGTGSSADAEVWVDGVSVCSLTGVDVGTSNHQAIVLGSEASTTTLCYYDDLVYADAYIGQEYIVYHRAATGAGGSTGWTNGTGSTYAEIDEVPYNTGDYLQNTSGTSSAHYFAFADISGIGTPTAVKHYGIFSEPTSTTTSVQLSYRDSGGTVVSMSQFDAGSTAWTTREAIWLTDAAGAAWTESNFNSAQFGIRKGTDSSSVRCAAIFVEVLIPTVVAADLVLSAAAGVATAALTLSTIASLVLGQVDGLSTAAAPVISRVLMTMQSDGAATVAGAVSTPGYIVPSQVDGVATAAAAVISPALLTLSQVDGIASLDEMAIVTAPGDLGSLFADGIAAVTAALSTQALLALSQSDGVALATAAVSTTGYLVLGQVDGLAAPTLALQSPAHLGLSASDGVASALATVSTTGFLVLGQVDGIASPTLALQAPALLALSQSDGVALPSAVLSSPAMLALGQVDGVATSAISVYAPAYLTLSQADGLSSATLAVYSPALFTLLADGVATATATVISPALLSLSSAGVATATAAVGAAPYFLIYADGVATAIITEITFGPHTKVRIPGGIVVRAVIAGGVTPRAGIGGGVNPRVITAGGIPVLVRVGGGAAPRTRIGSGY